MNRQKMYEIFSSSDLDRIEPLTQKNFVQLNPDVIFVAYRCLPKLKRKKVLQKMYLNGADLNYTSDRFRMPLLGLAVLSNDLEMISFLLKRGAQGSILKYFGHPYYSNILSYVSGENWWKDENPKKVRAYNLLYRYALKEEARLAYLKALEDKKNAEKVIRKYQRKYPDLFQKEKE